MLKIEYRLTGSGWAACSIHTGENQYRISASYLTDALAKLVLAGVAILAGAQSVAVSFDEEPGEYRWVMVLTDNQRVRLELLEFEELWGNRPDAEGTSLLSYSCDPLEFGKAVRDMAEEVLRIYGVVDYKKQWGQHDFPVAELDLLKCYVLRWERNR